MNFSTNQNRQFYVATAATKDECAKGEYLVLTLTDGTKVKTDFLTGVEYINVTKSSKLAVNKTKVTATLDGKYNVDTPVLFTVEIPDYVGGGEGYVRSTVISVEPASTSALKTDVADKVNEKLKKAFPEYNVVASILANEISITAEYKESNWIVGVSPMRTAKLAISGEHVVETAIEEEAGNVKTGNKVLADLEYFCKGERGDQYRMMGYPNVIPSRPSAIALDTTDYYVYDIHFSYVGTNEMVQKSEKDITIVATTEILSGVEIGGIVVPKYPEE